MNASVAIQVLPSVQDEEEVIRIVDEVIDYIKSTGLNYYVGPVSYTHLDVYKRQQQCLIRCLRTDDSKIWHRNSRCCR